MSKKVLVTGGLGFIGSHLVDALIKRGYEVRIFDNLEHQVHKGRMPAYANPDADSYIGDMRDRETLRRAMQGVEIILHQAAMVGVGQSMYEIGKYVSVNCLGTANILEILANEKHCVQKIIVASSMSVYGEGEYSCPNCSVTVPEERPRSQLENQQWEMFCPHCKAVASPVPTKEEKILNPGSVYAISKRDQEELTLTFGKAYKIPVIALRYFNGYGTRQSLSNPYTGVCAIFSSRYRNNESPLIFEDGLQKRDFIHVSDVVQANILAIENPGFDYKVLNVGSGTPITILKLSRVIKDAAGSEIEPEVTKKFRIGDIRHCYADISKIRALGYAPKVSIQDGIRELITWTQEAHAEDRVSSAWKELNYHKLLL